METERSDSEMRFLSWLLLAAKPAEESLVVCGQKKKKRR
jgi:hypothetical protein